MSPTLYGNGTARAAMRPADADCLWRTATARPKTICHGNDPILQRDQAIAEAQLYLGIAREDDHGADT